MDSQRAARWGLQVTYTDTGGQERRAPDASVAHVLASLDRGEGTEEDGPPAVDALVVRRPGDPSLPAHLQGGLLVAEDGTSFGPVDALPPGLPLGCHMLEGRDGRLTTVVVSPGSCELPEDLVAWGWALQVYAARSRTSWGMGDLADARAVGEWSLGFGGQPLLLLNPLHAVNPTADPEPSPYSAGSRCFHNPLYLRVEELPGAAAIDTDLAPIAAAGRALLADRRIDRARVWGYKAEALERLWSVPHAPGRAAAEAAIGADPVLAAFAAYCVAVERHGPSWPTWPEDLRRPDGPGWGRFNRDHADRVAFHAWLQGLMATQLSALQATVPIVHDLAVGTGPNGFDAWYWQDLFVLDGTTVGAPPDQFNTLGQDWSLPPMDPWRLRAAVFEPLVRMLRCAFEHGAGVRIDHVMGLFRLFWIPPDAGPIGGVYVRQPTEELLDVIALESVRAGAFVVGEDLGTVEPGVREELANRRLLAYRVLELEERHPDDFPELAVASASTHDLPTLPGFWSGADLAAQERLDLAPNVADTLAARARLRDMLGVADDAPVDDVVLGTYRLLANAPSRVVVGQLDDVAGVEERPNMPGTTTQWPNWSLALPRPLEDLLADPAAAAAADTLASPRR